MLDPTFNKSVCLDLESFLIQRLSGDGHTRSPTATSASPTRTTTGARSTRRSSPRSSRNSGRRALQSDAPGDREHRPLQAVAVQGADRRPGDRRPRHPGRTLRRHRGREPSQIVVHGEPGTGKTVVAIYLMKLLSDIKSWDPSEQLEAESPLAEFFVEGYPELLHDFRIGLRRPADVAAQDRPAGVQADARAGRAMVMSPFEVGNETEHFDLLVVDEAHRLRQSGNQPAGPLNKMFSAINEQVLRARRPRAHAARLGQAEEHAPDLPDGLGAEHPHRRRSGAGARRPHTRTAMTQHRRYRLTSQMRVQAGEDYVGYVRAVLSDDPPAPRRSPTTTCASSTTWARCATPIRAARSEVGLARLVAGFAWPWASQRTSPPTTSRSTASLRWNSTDVDWVNSPSSADEVGVIHTIQGYDLNYAGVIIGPDLRYDPGWPAPFRPGELLRPDGSQQHAAPRHHLHRRRHPDLVQNIYAVLLTRGMLGTYVYVCDRPLREHLRPYLGDVVHQPSKRGASEPADTPTANHQRLPIL